MECSSKLKTVITSTVVAIGCAGVTFLVFKYKFWHQNAIDALTYLTIKTVATEDSCDKVIKELRRRITLHKAIGFDCEWVTTQGRRHPVALVQLSSFDGYCGLFRLSHLKTIPSSLKELLEDETIYKVGVAPFDDAKYLLSDYSVKLKSTLDLRHIVELFGYAPGGLAHLAKSHLHINLDKSWRVRCSDWEAEELSKAQVNYAAADAHVAIKIFVNVINEQGSSIWSWLQGHNNNNVWDKLNDICWKYADVSFKTKQNSKQRNETINKHNQRKVVNENSLSKRYPNATRTKPLYHNCFLEAPDGELLCTCDTRKAEWYIEKQLADIIKEDPLTVRLRFEPAGRSVGDVGRYYQLTKENICVVCGDSNSYIRKNVVPREYRKYFPDVMKDHSSHDVLLLCVGCHRRSNVRDQSVRERLAELCGAPCRAAAVGKYTEDAASKRVRSAARTLLNPTYVLPDARRKELENIVLQHFPERDTITEDLLRETAEMQFLYENMDYESHGQKVVEHFLKHDGLLRLEEMWREHFLVSMRPKYMPELWSVKHNEDRLRVRLNEGRLSEEDAKLIGLSKSL